MGKKPRREDPDEMKLQDALFVPAQSPQEFAEMMFGVADTPVEGLPSLEWIKDNYKTKSAAIRYLVSQGHKVGEISKHLGIRYQQVRNVATKPLKRGPNEDWRPKEERQPQPLIEPAKKDLL